MYYVVLCTLKVSKVPGTHTGYGKFLSSVTFFPCSRVHLGNDLESTLVTDISPSYTQICHQCPSGTSIVRTNSYRRLEDVTLEVFIQWKRFRHAAGHDESMAQLVARFIRTDKMTGMAPAGIIQHVMAVVGSRVRFLIPSCIDEAGPH